MHSKLLPYALLPILAAAGACHSKGGKSGPSQASQIATLDDQVESQRAGAVIFIAGAGLDQDLYSLHMKAVDDTARLYASCSEPAREQTQLALVQTCADDFELGLKDKLKHAAIDSRKSRQVTFDELNERILGLGDEGASIAEELTKVQDTYTACQIRAFDPDFDQDSGLHLRACEAKVEGEIVRLDVAIKSADVNVLDTIPE